MKEQVAEFTEVERYEFREGPAYRFEADRREFVQALGAGLMIAVAVDAARRSAAGAGGGAAGLAGGRRRSFPSGFTLARTAWSR